MEEIGVKTLDVQPILSELIEGLNLEAIFAEHIKEGKEEIPTSQVLCVLLRNILTSSSPLYKISDWLTAYSDGQGEYGAEARKYNDSRCGRALDSLYAANRHLMMTRVSGRAIEKHGLNTGKMHNDTTTITFTGQGYDLQPGGNVSLKHGYNKDNRPDCVQLVFGLNVCGDGHIPLLGQLYDGNKTDDSTHKTNWNALRDFLKTEDFIYIADSKLSTVENLGHISQGGGKFISILPKTRKEVGQMYASLASKTGEIPDVGSWTLAYERESSRKRGKLVSYKYFEGTGTKEGWRIAWIHSSSKAGVDCSARNRRIETVTTELEALAPKLNRYHLKTREDIEKRIEKIVKKDGGLFNIDLIEHEVRSKKKIGRGRHGPNCKYREQTSLNYELKWSLNQQGVEAARTRDGIFPLVTNTELEVAQVLKTYKEQPFLEKRFNNLKSVLEVAPVFLKKPERIEAILFLYFIALMIMALIERKVRNSMKEQDIEKLPILPQGKKTEKPTWNNIRCFFNCVIAVSLTLGVDFQKYMIKGLTPQHVKVLKLLDVPIELYNLNPQSWWIPLHARAG